MTFILEGHRDISVANIAMMPTGHRIRRPTCVYFRTLNRTKFLTPILDRLRLALSLLILYTQIECLSNIDFIGPSVVSGG